MTQRAHTDFLCYDEKRVKKKQELGRGGGPPLSFFTFEWTRATEEWRLATGMQQHTSPFLARSFLLRRLADIGKSQSITRSTLRCAGGQRALPT